MKYHVKWHEAREPGFVMANGEAHFATEEDRKVYIRQIKLFFGPIFTETWNT